MTEWQLIDCERFGVSPDGPSGRWSSPVAESFYYAQKRLGELEAKVEELQALKSPIGDDSPSQQARAWERVWCALVETGLLSFMPTPLRSSSSERVVQYVQWLKTQSEERAQALAKMEAKVKELRQHVSDCQSGMYINCVYCGHRYGPKGAHAETVKDGLPMAEALRQHIEVCSEHPMSKLKAEVERLQKEEDKAYTAYRLEHSGRGVDAKAHTAEVEEWIRRAAFNRSAALSGETWTQEAEDRAATPQP